VTNLWLVANGTHLGDRSAAGKCPATRRRRFHGFLKIDGCFDTTRHWTKKLFNQCFLLNSLQLLSVCLTKNVYKMTVVCSNYAVASYLWPVTTVMTIDTMLPPVNCWQAFYWRKYRRSVGDSCIANKLPENAQWNAPRVVGCDIRDDGNGTCWHWLQHLC